MRPALAAGLAGELAGNVAFVEEECAQLLEPCVASEVGIAGAWVAVDMVAAVEQASIVA